MDNATAATFTDCSIDNPGLGTAIMVRHNATLNLNNSSLNSAGVRALELHDLGSSASITNSILTSPASQNTISLGTGTAITNISGTTLNGGTNPFRYGLWGWGGETVNSGGGNTVASTNGTNGMFGCIMTGTWP